MGLQPSRIKRDKFLVICSLLTLALGIGALIGIPSTVRSILSSKYMPHAMCYLNDRQLIALHVACDAAIWLAYVSISGVLLYLVWRTRREIPFSWMFVAFGVFIIACGFTHLMEIVVLWKPMYWLSGDIKLITALASILTAVALPGLVPQVHSMVTAAHLSEYRRLRLERANSELKRISFHVMHVQDSERRRIARELHDGVGQYLAAIKLSCDRAAHRFQQPEGSAALEDALKLLERCTSEVRTMSHLLHPPVLEEMGLAVAIPWYVEGFTTRSGVAVDLDMPPRLDRLPGELELAVFRILQESLTNIHRHSGSKTAKIQIRNEGGAVQLVIEDFGTGFNPRGVHPGKHGVGIASMRERIRELNGELNIESKPTGTRLKAVIPVAATKDADTNKIQDGERSKMASMRPGEV